MTDTLLLTISQFVADAINWLPAHEPDICAFIMTIFLVGVVILGVVSWQATKRWRD